MELPVIIVNFKIYEQSTGENAVVLAKICERVAQETGQSVAVAVNPVDLRKVCEAVSIPVFAQHIDPVVYGSGTGKILAKLAKSAGAFGTLLNHSEYQISEIVLKDSIARAKEAGLFTVVCADTPERGGKIKDFEPDLIAVEPPELIGGDISVSKAGPEIIEHAVDFVGKNQVLVGAGIRDPEDVTIALRLGACGVLVASGVVKAADPYAVLSGLVSGLKAGQK